MGCRYDDQFRGGTWSSHLAMFGWDGTITVTPYGSSASTVSAQWEPGRVLYEQLEDGARQGSSGVLALDPSQIASWTPDVRDKFSVDGVAYAVTAVARPDGSPIVELEGLAISQRRVGDGVRRLP